MLPGRQYTPGDYAAMAWRHRWLLIVPTFVGLYVALIVSSRMPNIYGSEMLLQVVPQRIPDSYVRSTITMRTEDRINSLTEQIKSRSELERLIVQMDLYKDERARMPMQDVVEIMYNAIAVDIVGGRNQDPDSFYIRFRYSDPGVATRVTERLGAMFMDVNAKDRGNLAQVTDNFLQTQLADATRKLDEIDLKLKEFRERNAGRLPTQLQFNMQAMQTAQAQLQSLAESVARDKERRLTLESTYNSALAESNAAAATAAAMPVPTAPPGGALPIGSPTGGPAGTTAQQIAQVRDAIRLHELTKKADHPDVVRTKRVLAGLEAKLEQEKRPAAAGETLTVTEVALPPTAAQAAQAERLRQMAAEIDSLKRQIAYRESQEPPLRERLNDLQRRIEQVPGVETEWIALTRNYDTQQAAYRDLLMKSEEARRAAELEQRQVGEQFRIVDARTPIRPTGVNRLEVNGIGAAAGLGLGLLLVGFIQVRDKTFRTADDIIEVFKLPVIAKVPRLISDNDRRRARSRQWLVSAVVAVAVLAAGYGFWTWQLWKHIA